MLTNEEEAAFKQSIQQVKVVAKSNISQTNSAVKAIHFVKQVHRGVDKVTEKYAAKKDYIMCRDGCSHCCVGTRVEVTMPEALYIARQLQALPLLNLARIVEQLAETVEGKRQSEVNQSASQQACTFLVNDLCSIYAFRPAVCRKAHSKSIQACMSDDEAIPQDLQLIMESEALSMGASEAYASLGFSAEVLELNAALLMILNNPSIEADWYQAGVN